MAYVVTEQCIRCKYTDCVEPCPVDCFYEGPNMLVIHPHECIDCGLCVPECPVDAIMHEDEVPDDQQDFVDLNEEMSEIWPNIYKPIAPPENADQWAGTKGKAQFLEK